MKRAFKKIDLLFLLGLLTLCVVQMAHAQTDSPPALPSLPGLSEMELPPDPSEAIIESDSLPPPPAFSGAFTPTPPPQQSQEEFEEEARREAFEAALQGLLPLRPDEIRTLLEHFDRTRESVETPIYPDPKPEVAVETVPLDHWDIAADRKDGLRARHNHQYPRFHRLATAD